MTTAPPDAGFGLWEALVALGMLVMNLVGAVVGGTWALGRSREKVHAKIDQLAIEMERQLKAENDRTKREAGETASALRQKLTEVEFFVRDKFVSKETFTDFMQQMRLAWERLENKIDKRDERLDKRLDAIDEKLNNKSLGA
jgi:predicted nucleotidyltransferase